MFFFEKLQVALLAQSHSIESGLLLSFTNDVY